MILVLEQLILLKKENNFEIQLYVKGECKI